MELEERWSCSFYILLRISKKTKFVCYGSFPNKIKSFWSNKNTSRSLLKRKIGCNTGMGQKLRGSQWYQLGNPFPQDCGTKIINSDSPGFLRRSWLDSEPSDRTHASEHTLPVRRYRVLIPHGGNWIFFHFFTGLGVNFKKCGHNWTMVAVLGAVYSVWYESHLLVKKKSLKREPLVDESSSYLR